MILNIYSGTIGQSLALPLLLSVTFVTAIPAGDATTTTSATGTSVTGLPTGWEYYGCWVDGVSGRILLNEYDSANLTRQACVAQCISGGYSIAGLEYSTQCFCDNAIHNGGALASSDAECNDPCGGDSTQICGGGDRVSLYSTGPPQVFQPPAAQKDDLPPNWTYGGCLQDNVVSKPNPNEDDNTVNISTFPYRLPEDDTNMTATACISRCQAYGYNAAGIEVGTQCYCGDVENTFIASDPIVTTSPLDQTAWQYAVPPVIVDDSQCTVPCSGNSQYLCGANNLLTYYYWNGTQPLYTWDFPQGASAGEYSLLIGGVTVPLITAQVVTGKVTFIEKTQTGFPNGTGVYELDLSLVNEPDSYQFAWRQMNEMITDVFCAAGLILPDKAGRQLTVGGWNGDSNFGVRLYVPDGSDGVNGTNQWQEDPSKLTLQLPRWYPSAMVMANGSIMIVGGEISENNVEQPTLELLPATGVPDTSTYSGYSNTTVYLDFLDKTAPDNLYPFVCVLPSGGIFIGYYNEARILSEVDFSTTKILPNIPGAVNDDTGGRSYSLEGSMVILPQYAPYTDPLTILICGGSTPSGHYALDNCVSTQPEEANPTWTIERMPSRRVMSCMAGLPDGTYIIMNGAHHGAAGFGLGGDPNYNAVLYDPTQPVNSRMKVMGNTTVARLYHSEAIILLDGRVLVTGSDPTGLYEDTNPTDFPEEYRVEVYSPPYLLSGLARPTFTIQNTDWAYGESITFTVTSGTASRVSLLGSAVSTHGNAMGQRTIFPELSCSGTTCTIIAPPNAYVCPPGWFMMFVLDGPTPSVGQFVRIGGDPASLGNWPDLPGFDLPGV